MVWFEFNQNNSGGSFDVDEMVCHRVFIEANSPEEANKLALDMGIYFDGVQAGLDCGCCGDRWSELWKDDKGITFPFDYGTDYRTKKRLVFSTIEEYAQYLANEFAWTTPDIRLYFADGKTVKEFSRQPKE